MNSALPIDCYEPLLLQKEQRLSALLAQFSPPKLAVFRSVPQNFRMRAEFRIWHDQDDFYHAMFDAKTKRHFRVDTFPIASVLINKMMGAILPLLKKWPILSEKLFQIDYLSTLSNQIIVSLLYHKPLTSAWQTKANLLRQELQALGFNLQLVGRAKKQKICLEYDFVDEVLPVLGKHYIYRQVENSFTQPNALVNCQMLEWAIEHSKNHQGDLLELYCGNGNFSIALAGNFRRVLATEIANPSVVAANYNIQANGIDNVVIVRMSAEELTNAMAGVREYYRLKEINLNDYQCQTVLVDPPRSGLSLDTLKLLQNYNNIIYISCNPMSLVNNLHILSDTHEITATALFDQFPYTEHIESGIFLKKK